MKTYIIGHKKPDLDATVATISFSKLANLFGNETATPVITEQINEETKYVFEKFSVAAPQIISANIVTPEDKFILVDHNEAEQRMDDLNPDQIIRIYDHHKLNLSLQNPIEVQILPVGSSNTIAWTIFEKNNFPIDPQLASLMLCAVLSDTVGLKSSTTTETDKKAVTGLAQKANIADIDGLTLEIFKAKSNISALSDEEAILNDYKIFDFGKKVLIGQLETVEQDVLISTRKSGIINTLQLIKDRENVDYIILAVTDILKVNTKLLVVGNEEIDLVQKAFGGTVSDNVLDIGPKMSRKKDIAPVIENSLKQ